MRRKALRAAFLLSGLTPLAAVHAQAADQQPVAERPVVPQPAAAAPRAQNEAAPAPAKVAEAIDPAEKDLAAVPPEEPRPGKIDPNAARRAFASGARSAPRPAPAAAEQMRTARVEQAEAAPAPADAEIRRPLPAYAAEERAPRPALEQRLPVRSAAAEPPADRFQDRRAEPAYASDDAPRRPAYDDRSVDDRAADRDEAQDMRSASAEDDRAPGRGFDDGSAAGALYAGNDSDMRPPYARSGDDRERFQDERAPIDDREAPVADEPADRQLSDHGADKSCDAGQADRLQHKVQREAETGMIDRGAAQDLIDEIGYTEKLRRSYCASGMNDWREGRLSSRYAQIAERIQYEESSRQH